VKVVLNGLAPKAAPAYRVTGFPAASDDMVIHNQDIEHLVRGVNERVFRVDNGKSIPPLPTPGAYDKLNYLVLRFADPALEPLPLTSEEFVDTYKGRRRTIAQQASEEFLRCGLRRHHSVVSLFGKREKLNIRRKPDPVQRVISPRSPVFNFALGRYTKAVEHRLYEDINRLFGYEVMAKGKNFKQVGALLRGHWDNTHSAVALGYDASRFDQHVSVDALKFEHKIYDSIFLGKYPELRRLLKHQLRNRYVARHHQGTIKFTKSGGRCSGDMNTGLGNCLIMCMLWLNFRDLHPNLPFRLVNNGDDCVVITESKLRRKFDQLVPRHFLRFGFTMVAEAPTHTFERIEFCQCQPVWDGSEYVMCRNPLSVVEKDAIKMTKFHNEEQFRIWCSTVGLGGLSLTAGIPMLQEYYQLYANHHGKGTYKGDELEQSGLVRFAGDITQAYRPITERSRVSFFLAYGIPPSMQLEFETSIKAMPTFEFGPR